MWQKTLLTVGMMKNYLSFFLTLISVVGVLVLAWFKGIDVTVVLPTLVGLYVGGRAFEKVSMVKAAAGDSDSNTKDVIQMVTGK